MLSCRRREPFSSSLTFPWTKYVRSLLPRRLKSCNNGTTRVRPGRPAWPPLSCFTLTSAAVVHHHHAGERPCLIPSSGSCWGQERKVSVLSQTLRSRAVPPYIQEGCVCAAPLSYYRQQVQMAKGRCSAKRQKHQKHLVRLSMISCVSPTEHSEEHELQLDQDLR